MMGRSHATIGALCGLAVAAGVGGTGHPETVVLSTLVGAGAALVPDLDEVHSTVARAGGLATWVVAHVTHLVCGGHRRATHSLLGIAVIVGILASAVAGSGDASAVIGGLLVALAVRVGASVVHLGALRRILAEVLLGAAAGWALVGISPWLVVGVVAAGMVSHTLADACTDSGTPLLWPARHRFSLHLFHTGSRKETLVRGALYVLLAAAAYASIAPHAALLGQEVHQRFIGSRALSNGPR